MNEIEKKNDELILSIENANPHIIFLNMLFAKINANRCHAERNEMMAQAKNSNVSHIFSNKNMEDLKENEKFFLMLASNLEKSLPKNQFDIDKDAIESLKKIPISDRKSVILKWLEESNVSVLTRETLESMLEKMHEDEHEKNNIEKKSVLNGLREDFLSSQRRR